MDNLFQRKHLTGVQLRSGLKYSSLSMGTGEQRTIKILDCVLKAEPYSLILIDEIDLFNYFKNINDTDELIKSLNNEMTDKYLFRMSDLITDK